MNQGLLIRHIMLFNQGVRSHDFSEMLEQFAEDAELVFEGVQVLNGIAAIAKAYATNPPTDEMKLLRAWEENGEIIADYAWRGNPYEYAGQMILGYEGDKITRLVVIYQ